MIGYDHDDKDSRRIWNTITNMDVFEESLFPKKLREFLEIDKIKLKR